MPMRERQKLEMFGAGDIIYQREEINPDTGYSRKVDVSQCVKLPDPVKTNLAKMIKAGVSLERVNCELLDPVGSVSLPPTKEEIEALNKKENEDAE